MSQKIGQKGMTCDHNFYYFSFSFSLLFWRKEKRRNQNTYIFSWYLKYKSILIPFKARQKCSVSMQLNLKSLILVLIQVFNVIRQFCRFDYDYFFTFLCSLAHFSPFFVRLKFRSAFKRCKSEPFYLNLVIFSTFCAEFISKFFILFFLQETSDFNRQGVKIYLENH